MNNPHFLTVSVDVADKFGNYGLIGVVIIQMVGTNAKIDTWIMSCRVLKRTVEHTVMNYVVGSLLKLNIETLNGQYIPTEKNKLVLNLLRDLGMSETKTHDYALNDGIELSESTVAADLPEWDSLNHIYLVVAIEKQFKIKFTTHQIQSWQCVGDVLKELNK